VPEIVLALAVGVAAVLTGGAARAVTATPFDAPERAPLARQSSLLGVLGIALLVVGLLGVLAGLLTLFFVSAVGLLAILEGALTAFLGLVLLAASADVGFLSTTRGYEEAHTANAISSLQTFFRTLGLLATLMVLVVGIRLWLFFGG
jgi:hypothetical protein